MRCGADRRKVDTFKPIAQKVAVLLPVLTADFEKGSFGN